MLGRIHFIHIWLEPAIGLAETTNKVVRFRERDGSRAGPIVQGQGAVARTASSRHGCPQRDIRVRAWALRRQNQAPT